RRCFELVERCAAALDLGDDVLCGGFPHEWVGVGVPVFSPGSDRIGELGDAAEHAAAQSLVGQLFEPALDQVQPGAAGRGEMQVPARPSRMGQPFGDRGRLCADRLSSTTCTSRSRGTAVSICLKNASTSVAAWPLRRCVWTCPVATFIAANRSTVPCRLSSCVIVAARPRLSGSDGWVRSSAWQEVFSSKLNTAARAGGSRYNPTTSTIFSSNRGSVLALKVSIFHGFRP